MSFKVKEMRILDFYRSKGIPNPYANSLSLETQSPFSHKMHTENKPRARPQQFQKINQALTQLIHQKDIHNQCIVKTYQTQIINLRKQLEDRVQQIKNLGNKVNQDEIRFHNFQEQIRSVLEKQKELQSINRSRIEQFKGKIGAKFNQELNILKFQFKAKYQQLISYNLELETLIKQYKQSISEREQVGKSTQGKDRKIQQLEGKLTEYREIMRRKDKETQISSKKGKQLSLKNNELIQANRKIKDLQLQKKQKENQIKQKEERIIKMKGELEKHKEMDVKYNAVVDQLQQLKIYNQKIMEQLNHHQQQAQQLTRKNQLLKNNAQQSNNKGGNIIKENQNLLDQITKLTQELERSKKRVKQLSVQKESIEDKKNSSVALLKLKSTEFQKEILQLKQKLERCNNQKQGLQKQKMNLAVIADKFKNQKNEALQKINEVQANLFNANKQKQGLVKQNQLIKANNNQIVGQKSNQYLLKLQIERLNKQVQEAKKGDQGGNPQKSKKEKQLAKKLEKRQKQILELKAQFEQNLKSQKQLLSKEMGRKLDQKSKEISLLQSILTTNNIKF